ncbi:MAG: selenocysteine-specific translation elongation factor [Oscillospiraceae bacterium]
MTNSIIGTAGHVDHGKTSLIRALTGMDTDRLNEEKKRGITIDLGFAHIDLPDGSQAGIIDVPGHEKFIRNMLAGAGGIDLVLMVIAADEGIMPQTREHMDILSLLNIKKGIVVLTKSDMVDSDWLEFMQEEVKKGLEGSFLENAPICCVSSQTGKGIDELRNLLFKMLLEQQKNKDDIDFRLPVDRIFSVDGFGAVVTGTLIEGKLNVGYNLMIYPSKIPTKSRNIQVHSQNVQTAYAGQRTAVNLAGLKKTDIKRGDILAPLDSVEVTKFLDVNINVLKNSSRTLKNNSSIHFYHGSCELTAKIALMDCDEIASGKSGFAQLRFDEEFAVKAGDCFVLRFLSPLETIAGGVILNTMPPKRKRLTEETIETFKIEQNGKNPEKINSVIKDCGSIPINEKEISLKLNIPAIEVVKICEKLSNKKEIIDVAENIFLHKDEVNRIKTAATILLEKFHKENPLKKGIKREEIRTKLRPNIQIQYMDRILNQLINQKALKEQDGCISLFEFAIEVNDNHKKINQEILELYEKGKFSPPTPEEVIALYPKIKGVNQLLSKMITDGELVRLSDKIYMSKNNVDESLKLITKVNNDKNGIILSDVRDVLGTSRKFALALLEYFDSKKITKKNGDIRTISK